jgi:hypothetical protein
MGVHNLFHVDASTPTVVIHPHRRTAKQQACLLGRFYWRCAFAAAERLSWRSSLYFCKSLLVPFDQFVRSTSFSAQGAKRETVRRSPPSKVGVLWQ